MPLQLERIQGNVVFVRMSGKLTDDDYKGSFVPHMDDLFEKWGNLRILFVMEPDFTGWDLHGAWDEFKFQLRHGGHVIKVGVVGDHQWEKWATKLSKLFTGANVQFFSPDDLAEAQEWVTSGW